MWNVLDADFERLVTAVTALATLAGVAYTAFQNGRQRKQLDTVHKETLTAIQTGTGTHKTIDPPTKED
jgi:uncharacterized membrane protein YebE (DUF533 family)